jgi:hypothetical protein
MSPQSCTICEHPDREAIEAALEEGEAGRAIARRFQLTEASMRRHRTNHLGIAHEDAPEEEMPRAGEDLGREEEDARTIAERRVAAEEEERRNRRIAEYAREEEQRREKARQEAAREAHQRAWRAEADKLAEKRFELAVELEKKLADLQRGLDEYCEVDNQHLAALRNAGSPLLMRQPVESSLLAPWIAGRLGRRYVPEGKDFFGGTGLSDLAARDPLVCPPREDDQSAS